MASYQVGQLYHPNKRSWPDGVNQYNFRGREHELALFFGDPSRHELEAVRKGEAEFGLMAELPVILLCYRFGVGRGIPWSDAPFDFHKVKEADPDNALLPINWEEGSPETRALLRVLLVDSHTGILKALRVVTFSPEFTRAIHQAIWDQAHMPDYGKAYDRKTQELYARYPTSEAMAKACAVRTIGGA